MNRLIVGLLAAVGGLVIGSVGGRKTSNITFKDVKAAPGKIMSGISDAVKKTGKKVGSGLSTLAFWKKKKAVKTKVNLEKDHMDLVAKHQDLSEKYAKLSDDFSVTAKRKDLVETDLRDTESLLEQEIKKNEAYQTTVDEKDTELKEAAVDKKQVADDLKVAQTTIKKLEKAALETE